MLQGLGMMKAKLIQVPNENRYITDHKLRLIPHPLKENIDEIEVNDIIELHNGPVIWLSNPVLIPKANSSVWVTMNLRNLNKSWQDTHLPILHANNIILMFTDKSEFSKLDLKTTFYLLELKEESICLLIFHADDHLVQYKRLTMGTIASRKLNHQLQFIISGILNATVIQDDIIIAAANNEQLNRAFELVTIAQE